MSDRFIKFNDEQLDAKQVMMLQDLARLLLKNEQTQVKIQKFPYYNPCLLYTSPSPRDRTRSRMPSSA